MSWSYVRTSKAGVIKNALQESKRGDYNVTTRKHEVKDNVLWSIRDVKDATGKLISASIVCTVLQPTDDGWGWNSVPEEMHPYYYDVPLAWLDEVKVSKEEPGAQAWRKAVLKLAGVKKPMEIIAAPLGIA